MRFIQPMEGSEERKISSEALLINNKLIEEYVPGYKTLSVQGRELLGQEVQTNSSPGAHGSYLKSSRYPEREITVVYSIKAKDRPSFRESFKLLNRLLSGNDKKLQFADDPEYHFIGTLSTVEQVPTGSNSVVSSFTFLCADPFKYTERIKREGSSILLNIDSEFEILPTEIIVEAREFAPKVELSTVSNFNIHFNKYITVNTAVKAGDSVSFVFSGGIIKRNGINVMDKLDLTSDFEDFYIFDGSLIESANKSKITLYYKEKEL